MSKKKFSSNLGGKGYYIALGLCAVAIGITGYLYYRNASEPAAQPLPEDTAPVLSTEDVDVVGTDGNDTGDPNKNPQQDPSPQTSLKPVRPVSGDTALPYAMEMLCYNPTTRDWRVHDGIDISAAAGTAVCASAAGTVYAVYDDEKMGMTVVIEHTGGYITEYASLDENVQVAPGDQVSGGQVIGCVGDTALMESAIGDHLHFTVSCNGKIMDPEAFWALD